MFEFINKYTFVYGNITNVRVFIRLSIFKSKQFKMEKKTISSDEKYAPIDSNWLTFKNLKNL